jgi:hypothetical protein
MNSASPAASLAGLASRTTNRPAVLAGHNEGRLMKTEVRYLTKKKLVEVSEKAFAHGCNALKTEFLDGLPERFKYPVVKTLPWERPGWVRCLIETATCLPAEDLQCVSLDVPEDMFLDLPTMDVAEA